MSDDDKGLDDQTGKVINFQANKNAKGLVEAVKGLVGDIEKIEQAEPGLWYKTKCEVLNDKVNAVSSENTKELRKQRKMFSLLNVFTAAVGIGIGAMIGSALPPEYVSNVITAALTVITAMAVGMAFYANRDTNRFLKETEKSPFDNSVHEQTYNRAIEKLGWDKGPI